MSSARTSNKTTGAIGLALALATLGLYAPVLGHAFINFDDDQYVYQNSAVLHGLTPGGAASAFSIAASDNWVPLTTLSHMLDCQLYGLHPWGHHLGNVLLHMAALMPVFVTERYRLAAVPGLLLLGAYGLWEFWDFLNRAKWAPAPVHGGLRRGRHFVTEELFK